MKSEKKSDGGIRGIKKKVRKVSKGIWNVFYMIHSHHHIVAQSSSLISQPSVYTEGKRTEVWIEKSSVFTESPDIYKHHGSLLLQIIVNTTAVS